MGLVHGSGRCRRGLGGYVGTVSVYEDLLVSYVLYVFHGHAYFEDLF